ncbi:hypothetical protein THAOC_17571, partial [Thalassiosira oceanica]
MEQEHSSDVHGYPKSSGDQNSRGIYFKIRTKDTALNITGISLQIASRSTGSVEIFHKIGDFVDYEETSDAWTPAGEVQVHPPATLSAVPMGPGISNPNGHSGYEIHLDMDESVSVERSSYHSFYIHSHLQIVSHEASGGDLQYPVGGLL